MYDNLQNALANAETWERAARSLQASNNDLSNKLNAAADSLSMWSIRYRELEKERLAIQPNPKKWSVSVFAGYGVGIDTQIRTLPIVGVGISRTIFRF